jgi:hypothetical protein
MRSVVLLLGSELHLDEGISLRLAPIGHCQLFGARAGVDLNK